MAATPSLLAPIEKAVCGILDFAFLLAIAGWLWLPKVENDRIKRAELTDQIFLQKNITKLDVTVIPNALQARKDFTRSHLISLGMNMLCGLGMLLGIIFFAIVTAKRSLEPVQVPRET